MCLGYYMGQFLETRLDFRCRSLFLKTEENVQVTTLAGSKLMLRLLETKGSSRERVSISRTLTARVCVCVCLCVLVCVCVYIYTSMCVCVFEYVYRRTQKYVHVYIYTPKPIYIYVYSSIQHTHTHRLPAAERGVVHVELVRVRGVLSGVLSPLKCCT